MNPGPLLTTARTLDIEGVKQRLSDAGRAAQALRKHARRRAPPLRYALVFTAGIGGGSAAVAARATRALPS